MRDLQPIPGFLFGNEWIKSQDLHTESFHYGKRLGTHAAQTNDAKGLIEELDTSVLLAVPLALVKSCIGLGDVWPQTASWQWCALPPEIVFPPGCLNNDAFLGGRLHVHIVYADTCSADDLEPIAQVLTSAVTFVPLR